MNEVLLDPFRHHSWATKELIAACRGLPAERLQAPASAAFGSIMATLNHLIGSDAGYLHSLGGGAPAWMADRTETDDLDVLLERIDQAEPLWEHLLSQQFDPDRVLYLDAGLYQVHAGVLIAQALDHASIHREQICGILSGFGLEPPDLQPWAYADATGRGRELPGHPDRRHR